jgi:phospholipase/carboxylesterase
MAHAAAALSAAGVTVETHARPGLGHGIDPEGLEVAVSALRAAWPDAAGA